MRTPFWILLCACSPTATSTGYTPVTSVLVRADAIIAPSKCGRGPGQTPKYTLVAGQQGALLSARTYDCFADALIVPPNVGDVDAQVFAWSSETYEASAMEIARATSAQPPDIGALERLPAAARVSCKAVQQSGIQVVAWCTTLAASDGGSPVDASLDGADASVEGGVDAQFDAPEDAPEGG